MRKFLLCSVSCLALIPVAARAGDSTAAVSAPALTLETSGGSSGGNGNYAVGGMLALPLGHDFGMQVDANLGKSKALTTGGMGLHLFTRDPNAYLVGATAMWSRVESYAVYRYGVEGQLYLDDVTLSSSVGAQRGDANRGTTTSGYASAAADYYLFDNLKLGLGGGGFSSYRVGYGEAEWQPDGEVPFSIYADLGASITRDHHGLFLMGMRYTFGAPSTSLKERNRHGDPENIVRFMSAMSGAQPIESLRAPQLPQPVAVPPPIWECCFVAGTPILMADGTTKAIEDVQVGDKLRGRDGIVNTVLAQSRPPLNNRRIYAINDLGYFVTPEHPLLTDEGWKSFDPHGTADNTNAVIVTQLKIGDRLVTADGFMDITHIDSINASPNLTVYNFRLDGDDTYIAHGIVAHSYGRPMPKRDEPAPDKAERELAFA